MTTNDFFPFVLMFVCFRPRAEIIAISQGEIVSQSINQSDEMMIDDVMIVEMMIDEMTTYEEMTDEISKD